jgi:FlgD Ig-like domain
MKQYQRSLAVLAALCIGLVGTAHAQGVQPLWADYAVQYVNEFYNPLAGGVVLPGVIPGGNQNSPVNFVNFTGAIDFDNGTADSIPIGNWSFDYNGCLTNTVNININGWVSFNIVDLAAGGTLPNGPFIVQPINGIPVTPQNNNTLFSSVLPNNAVAPFWGDHYYRTTEPGYYPSTISYLTTQVQDPNPNAKPFSVIHTFTVEWKNLNINDKTNPNSIASFQLIIRQNPLANDQSVPDQRATIEFQYGTIGPNGSSNGTVQTAGAAVGAKDSVGFTHINALFVSASDENDVANNTSARTTLWPPSTEPGRAIQLVPQGRNLLSTWGDGDANLTQVFSSSAQVRNNQSLFVTLDDALLVLQSSANGVPLDSIEGGNAFHGDANHNGQVYNPTYGAYFYYTTPYDAAYIMMYLAGKLAELPWPTGLPVPGYKSSEIHSTDISGVIADASNVRVTGNTVLLPIVIRGNVNGPLSIQMDLKGLESSGVQFVGTRSSEGTIMASNASLGRVTLATSGDFSDGATVGYIELRAPANANADFDVENVQVNDMNLASSHVALKLADANASSASNLEQNVPNPFVVSTQSQTTIGFNLASPEEVTLRVFDVLGHEVRTLIAGEGRAAGSNTISWDGRDGSGNTVSSGMYFYQLTTPDFTQCEKMQVVR